MKKSVMKKWVKALRSGKYKQVVTALSASGGYCCLGVLCDISGQGSWRKIIGDFSEYIISSEDVGVGVLPTEVRSYAGMKTNNGEISFKKGTLDLTQLNDQRKRSFKQIACYIERNWEKL